MNARPRHLAACAALLLATAMASPAAAPPEVRDNLPAATVGVVSRFTFLGFQIYDASLWTTPGFTPAEYAKHAFALELSYLRDFTGEAIADRSVQEMRRQPGVTEAQLRTWKLQMQQVFPDVRKGDRLTGLHRPGMGAAFLFNGKPGGTIADEEFARRFFGIWLSAESSDTRLRDAVANQPPNR
jgi:hypothetical protein